MYEWNETVQKMIDYIEAHITEELTLNGISRQVGYSPYYCSMQFHRICKRTIKAYVSGRRLARAAVEIRDTDFRIIDIALKYGFSSQEALTRAFRAAFGCTPAAYRKNPLPVTLPVYKVIYFPEHYNELHKGENDMSYTTLTEAMVRIEYIPAHRYIGIRDKTADCYCDFWENHDCDEICGVINSMSNVCDCIVTAHTAGWYRGGDGKPRYFYGMGVPAHYSGEIPDGFEICDIPASYYIVFYHPPYDFMRDNAEVMGRVEALARGYNLEAEQQGRFAWNIEGMQCYQRHYPEKVGYEILVPIKLK